MKILLERGVKLQFLTALAALALAATASAQATSEALDASGARPMVLRSLAVEAIAADAPMAMALAATPRQVGLMGFYFGSQNRSFLEANGHTVVQVDQALISAGGLANLDVLYILRDASGLAQANAAAISAWVKGGGTLITEFTATQTLMLGNATFGLGGAAALVDAFWVPSGSVCGGNNVAIQDPGSPIAAGLPASWSCTGDPIGVFQVFRGLDPLFEIVARIDKDRDADGVNEPVVATACEDKGLWVPFFTDFADFTPLGASCGAGCQRAAEEELLLLNAVAATAKDACGPTVSTGGPYSLEEGGQMKLAPSTNMPGILSWEWDLNGDGVTDDFTENAWFNAALIDGPKTVPIRVTVRNDLGQEATAASVVNVVNAPPRGDFYISSQYRPEGSIFSLTLLGVTDPAPADRPTLRWAFDCGDGNGFGPLGTIRPVVCTALDDGVLAVRARIVDKDGGETIYVDQVRVFNRNPTAVIESPLAFATYPIGAPVDLLVSFMDAGKFDTHTCAIGWGDGSAGAGAVSEAVGSGTCAATHAYASAGTFKIIVTVTDDDGGDVVKLVNVVVK